MTAAFGLNGAENRAESLKQNFDTEYPISYFAVYFEPSFGIGATFSCLHIEIVEALPCNAEGSPTS